MIVPGRGYVEELLFRIWVSAAQRLRPTSTSKATLVPRALYVGVSIKERFALKWILQKLCILLLTATSFSSFGLSMEASETKKWFFDTQFVSSEVSGNSYLLAGVSIARRFYQHWFIGASSLANITEKQDSNIDGNVYPGAQFSLIAGYGNHLYKNIHYQISLGRGGGIGEFTQAGSDAVGVCQCSYDAMQATGEINYVLSSASAVALQVKYMSYDSGDIKASNTGFAAAYRYSW